jgi:hypothetical protein
MKWDHIVAGVLKHSTSQQAMAVRYFQDAYNDLTWKGLCKLAKYKRKLTTKHNRK